MRDDDTVDADADVDTDAERDEEKEEEEEEMEVEGAMEGEDGKEAIGEREDVKVMQMKRKCGEKERNTFKL